MTEKQSKSGGRRARRERRLLLDEEPTGAGTYDLWSDLHNLIVDGEQRLIPIISNAFMNNRIFDIDLNGRLGSQAPDEAVKEDDLLAIDEQLAQEWAKYIKYPLAENPLQISRVSQYRLVSRYANASGQAKREYLTFLKVFLIEIAANDEILNEDEEYEASAAFVDDLFESLHKLSLSDKATRLKDYSFSDLALRFGYPRFTAEQQNPLHLLAQLPLPLYITTSHHDFLERALSQIGKHPRVQVCNWKENIDSIEPFWFAPQDAPNDEPAGEPEVQTPLVYHLYGLEQYPSSLVLTEDDYMEFLVQVSKKPKTIPEFLRRRMTESSLLLLGYRLRGWDFRILFQSLIKELRETEAVNFAIQLDPRTTDFGPKKQPQAKILNQARQYLEAAYFEPSKFRVEWKDSSQFVQELSQKFRELQQ